MTPATTAPERPATRGRPRAFSDDEVLDALVQLFWTQGYEATSMADIVDATGLSKSSLYNTFGSKDELFKKALDRYIEHRTGMLVDVLADGTRGLDDVQMLFEALWAEVGVGGDHRGCLAINTSTELGMRDSNVVAVSDHFRTVTRDSLAAALSRAADLGEIDRARVNDYAAVLMAFMLGTAVIVRGGAPDDEIRRQLDAGKTITEGWRI